MKVIKLLPCSLVMLATLAASSQTRSNIAASATTSVPPLIPYSGVVAASQAANATVTFLIYKDEQGGEPLFTETQSVALDNTGHYKAQLGSTRSNGLPLDLFSTGEARWLEVQIAGEAPQPRALLVSVPYALKAADASTLGGLPPSAFALARPGVGTAEPTSTAVSPDTTSNVTTTGGTSGYVPVFNGAASIANSPVFVSGENVGIGTTTPSAPLTVNGAMTVTGDSTYYGSLVMPSINTATPTNSYASQFIKLQASAYNSATKSVVSPRYQWQALVTGNNTPNPGATLALYSSTGTAKPTPTGFYFNPDGTINFAPGQTFPGGTGPGGITGVTAGTALTGGGTSGNVKLNLDVTKVPLLSTSNTFVGTQNISGDLTASGTASAATVNAISGFDISGSLFAYGSASQKNVYVGFSGAKAGGAFHSFNVALGFEALNINSGSDNTALGAAALESNTDGIDNTASGYFALSSNTEGSQNTASGNNSLLSNTFGNANVGIGLNALRSNIDGDYNTGTGTNALYANTSGSFNTASGWALGTNTVGNYNSAFGYGAGTIEDVSDGTGSNNTFLGANTRRGTGSLNFATAIGADAEVTESNTLVLGCVIGLNNCPASVSVGIGTTTPDNVLTVNGTADKPGGGSWGTYSDGRLKTVNGSYGEGLNQVMQLRPIRYRYNPNNGMGIRDSDEHIGVVAQEVQRVIPEAVTENSKGYLLVNNDPIIWSMVNAIKEQQREIEQQKKLLRAQAAEMRSLAAEVRKTRESLRQAKAQAAAGSPTTLVAQNR